MNRVESAIAHWPYVAPLFRPLSTPEDYQEAVAALDAVLDAGGADESHSLAGLAEQLGEVVAAWEAQELGHIGDVFGDPKLLARYYIQPSCQHHNPADRHEDRDPMAQIRQPAFEVIDAFLKGSRQAGV